jgi:hypothetical protein
MNESNQNQKVYKIYDKKNIVIYIGSKTNLFSKDLLKKVKKIIKQIS